MAKYTQFWEEKIKIISKKISLDKESNFTIDTPEISEVGNRDESGYNGYLNTWIGQIEEFTNSAVFRNLRDVIKENRNYNNKFPGQVEFRIRNNSTLSVNYSPITYSILISRYQQILDLEKSLGEEAYKWQLIQLFQEGWNKYSKGEILFRDFFQTVKFENLMYELAVAVLRHLNKATPDEFEKLILKLFDESQLLETRISNYQENLKHLYSKLEDHGEKTFQEERTIATLLTFRYPEKYTFFKDTFYSAYCKGIGQKPKQPGQKIYHYYEIINDFANHLNRNNPDLISWKNQHLDENCYRDESNLILAQNIFYRVLDNKKGKETEVSSDTELQEPIEPIEMKTPLNQILYGPPGTGKTYHSIIHALSIIENKAIDELKKEQREELKKRFEKYSESRQVIFTTFHQSMSYEDFIEGIKPISPKSELGNIIYKVQDGIFKMIVTEARKTKQRTIKINQEEQELTEELFADFYREFVETLTPVNEKESNCSLKTKEGSKFELFKNSAGSVTIKSGQKRTKMSASLDELTRVLFYGKSPTYKSYESRIIQKIFEDKDYKESEIDNITKNFVLIIDEINRGNVANIFGELITLIEEDKRLGRPEQLKAILPYSKEEFGVPNNLYIIGTMNTADRSVEALDTALRRRFSFVEMKPNYDLKPLDREIIQGITSSRILKVINARIEKLLDKDHMIGHSYFLTVTETDDLKHAFQNKIIPLLQEYFYGDFGKIGLVLGDGFVKQVKHEGAGKVFADFEDYDEITDLEERKVYRLADLGAMSSEDFIKAVNGIFNKGDGKAEPA